MNIGYYVYILHHCILSIIKTCLKHNFQFYARHFILNKVLMFYLPLFINLDGSIKNDGGCMFCCIEPELDPEPDVLPPDGADPLGELPPEVDPLGEFPPELDPLGELPPEVDPLGELTPEVDPLGELPPEVDPLGELPPEVDPLGDIPPLLGLGLEPLVCRSSLKTKKVCL